MKARTDNAEANGTLVVERPREGISGAMRKFLEEQAAIDPEHAEAIREVLENGLRANEVEAMLFSDYVWLRRLTVDAETTKDRHDLLDKLIRLGGNLAGIVKNRPTTSGRIPNGVVIVVSMPDGSTVPAIDVSAEDDDGDEIPLD